MKQTKYVKNKHFLKLNFFSSVKYIQLQNYAVHISMVFRRRFYGWLLVNMEKLCLETTVDFLNFKS